MDCVRRSGLIWPESVHPILQPVLDSPELWPLPRGAEILHHGSPLLNFLAFTSLDTSSTLPVHGIAPHRSISRGSGLAASILIATLQTAADGVMTQLQLEVMLDQNQASIAVVCVRNLQKKIS